MRPRGEIREVLQQAAHELVPERGPVTSRDLAAHAGVGFDAARRTVDNMVRAGELVQVGQAKPAGSTRWHALYEPAAADDTPQPWGGIEALAEVMRQFPAAAD